MSGVVTFIITVVRISNIVFKGQSQVTAFTETSEERFMVLHFFQVSTVTEIVCFEVF
jgi:hypothetical protein